MLAVDERVQALTGMDQLINAFYAHAVRLNVHPFLDSSPASWSVHRDDRAAEVLHASTTRRPIVWCRAQCRPIASASC